MIPPYQLLIGAINQRDAPRIARLARELPREVFNTAGPHSLTPLNHALSSPEPDITIVQALLRAGAHPNGAPSDAPTPLTCAAKHGFVEAIEALLAHGADPNAVDCAGFTPLAHLARSRHGAVREATTALIRGGADPNAGGAKRASAPLDLALADESLPAIRALLEGGADPNLPGTGDVPPLYRLIRTVGRTLRLLRDGQIGAEHADLPARLREILTLLIDHGADPNLGTPHGDRPLHCAVVHNAPELIPDLVAAGANLDAQNSAGLTPWSLAEKLLPGDPQMRGVLEALAREHAGQIASRAPRASGLDAPCEGPQI